MDLATVSPVPPIPGPALLVFLLQLGILLLVAKLLGSLAQKIGMPAVVGELLAGVLLGPSLLAQVVPSVSGWLFPQDGAQFHMLDAVGQVGVLLLVGVAGMHMDLDMVRRVGGKAAKISIAGLLIPLGFGIGIGFLLPVPLRPEDQSPAVFAFLIGVAISVSAIPVIAKTLIEMKLAHRNVGQLVMTAAMIDDAVGWFLLSVVSSMATGGVRAMGIVNSLLFLVGVVVFAVVIGRPLVRAVMRYVTRPGAVKTTASSAVVTMLLISATATHALGLEAILGTFICGALIGASGVDMSAVSPLNNVVMSVLAPIFFATAGLRMDLTALWNGPLLLAAVGVLSIAILGKFLGAFIGGRASGLSWRESTALGAGMNARGVIEVIIAMVGLRLGVFGTEAYTVLIVVAVVTSVMAPPILKVTMSKAQATEEETEREKRTQLV